MKLKIGIILVFLGSVFLTSEKFVNTENAVKYYITVFALLIGIIIILFRSKNLKLEVRGITTLSVLKGLYIVGVFQSIYGILQYIGKYPSNHNYFIVTGSFDNPVGFIAILAMLFPIGVFWCIKSKSLEQRLVYFSVGLILFSIIISGSRTGLLAIIISTISIFIVEIQLFSKIQRMKHVNLIVLSSIILLLFGLFVLYKWRPDSANGRLLVWKVSYEMIKDKPIFGHGYGSFKAKYMGYQARYFEENPDSKDRLLADNVKHPFNEFILLGVEFGFVGLLLVGLIISMLILRIKKSEDEHRYLARSGIISFLTFATFSYPLQYVAVWLLLTFYILFLFKEMTLEISRTIFAYSVRFFVFVTAVLCLTITIKQIKSELKWKEIAMNSLRGHTVEMLPEYEKLFPVLRTNPLFLYNYGAELNVAGKYDESIIILSECQKRFNDYDLQLLLADNFLKKGERQKAIQLYENASNMIPCRFLPLYQIFEIYKDCGQKDMAVKYANEIINKKAKIPSLTVNSIKTEAEEYLKAKDANMLTLKQ